MQPLLCRALMTVDFDDSLVRALQTCFKPEVCDPGCTITEEGKHSDNLVLLISGRVMQGVDVQVFTSRGAKRRQEGGSCEEAPFSQTR